MTLADTYRDVAHQAMLDLVRQPREVVYAADPYIAALEAENEKLRCCGNCWYWEPSLYECARVSVYDTQRTWSGECDNLDRCHFTPSRWTAREETRNEH